MLRAMNDSRPGQTFGDGSIPEATFLNYISGLGAQTLIQLGAIPNPATGERQAVPALAKYSVDLLAIIAEKTKGNLTEEENDYLTGMLADCQRRLATLDG